MMWINFKLALY